MTTLVFSAVPQSQNIAKQMITTNKIIKITRKSPSPSDEGEEEEGGDGVEWKDGGEGVEGKDGGDGVQWKDCGGS